MPGTGQDQPSRVTITLLVARSEGELARFRKAGVPATSLILGAVKDAGFSARTLAETGLTANTSFAAKPEQVAAAALRAIDKGTAEIVVNPGPGRLLKALTDYFPGMGPVINRLSGADKLMTEVAEHREAARARKIAEEPGRPA